MRRFLTISIVLMVLSSGGILQSEQLPADATARVPALDSFHKVIARIWHEAWPKKDVAMLRQLLPEVEKGTADVAAAKLPAILHEKQQAWDEGVGKLREAAAEYKSAAGSGDDSRLLNAAEILHARFEGLVRAIRPVLKELDDFHSVLYMLYHHYVPGKELEKVKASAVELKQKMDLLNAATLPGRLKEKEPEFQAARSRLSKSVEAFAAGTASGDEKAIRDALESVHTDYQALEKVLE